MEKIHEIALYISTPSTGQVMFNAVQGDTGRKIEAAIFDDDGLAFAPGSGTTAEYWSVKPDKNGTQHAAEISGNTVTVQLTEQDLAMPGKVYAAIVLKNNDTVLAAMPFWFMVMAAPVGDHIASTSEYQTLVDATQNAEEATDRANQAAEHGPYIRASDLHWMIWDNELQEFEDSGVPAAGAEGVVLYSATQQLTNAQKSQARTNIGAGAAADIGNISNLETAAQTDLVSAINELVAQIGTLANLDTSVKTDLVNALNEVAAGVADAIKRTKKVVFTTPSFSSLPQTFTAAQVTFEGSVAELTPDLVVPPHDYILSYENAMGSGWDLDFSTAGQVTITGTFTGSTGTTLKAYCGRE